ncbi:MAG: class I SAM-dependent methyltransferase [Planctomycetaceae bacterium]
MNSAHWDQLAPEYDSEVFSVLAHDRRGLIARAIAQAGGPRRIASDLGCGPGRFLPLLAANFRRVYAVDHSAPLIDQARHHCRELSNIQYVVADVSQAADLPAVHCALSVNALLSPAIDQRRQTLDFYSDHVHPSGTLVLVVPSLESAHLSRQMLIEWNFRTGATPSEAVEDGFESPSLSEVQLARQGVLDAGGVPTKHYLREELEAALSGRRFRIQTIEKLEYPWTTEFHSPPPWMQSPLPWDWLLIAQRRRAVRRSVSTSSRSTSRKI